SARRGAQPLPDDRAAGRRHARRDLAAGRVLRAGLAARAAQAPEQSEAGRRNTARNAAVNAAKRRKIYERFARANPEPKTELAYTTPFELLVAVVLSAQATDVS